MRKSLAITSVLLLTLLATAILLSGCPHGPRGGMMDGDAQHPRDGTHRRY